MKFIPLVCVAISLSAWAADEAVPVSEEQNAKAAEAIKAFEDVCLKTAPTFSGAEKAASSFGITEFMDAGFMKMGFNEDQSLGVQITVNSECVITASSLRDESLTRQFLQAVSRHTPVSPSSQAPIKSKIGGIPFIFHHDRKEGETFVMLKAND